MRKLLALLAILLMTSCTWDRKPDKYPLTVVSIYNDGSCPGYSRYSILDHDPRKNGWGVNAMYITLIDKEGKFQVGDTIVFNKLK